MHIQYIDPQPSAAEELLQHRYGEKNVSVARTTQKASEYYAEQTPDVIICNATLLNGETGLYYYYNVMTKGYKGIFVLYSANQFLLGEAKRVGIKIIHKNSGNFLDQIKEAIGC